MFWGEAGATNALVSPCSTTFSYRLLGSKTQMRVPGFRDAQRVEARSRYVGAQPSAPSRAGPRRG